MIRNFRIADLLPGIMDSLRSRVLIVLTAITILIYGGVGLFYKVLSLALIHPAAQGMASFRPAQAAPLNPEGFNAYQVILDRNLFRSTDRAVAGPGGLKSGMVGGATEAMGVLELRGTVAGENKYAFAIIEDKDKKKQTLYRIGDRVGMASLTRIRRTSIVLRDGGQDIILKIPETIETSIMPASGSGAAPGQATLGTINVNRNEITSNLKDMGTMLTQAQIRPFFNQGVADGFQLSSIRPGSIYQKIGLQEGDILQGINDRKIQTADDMIELYNVLRSANRMALKIKRQNNPQTIQYTFN
ncbi:MAG: type II secretion system protein N [Syntrophales bacterium]|jgi:general secretion pathway protein C